MIDYPDPYVQPLIINAIKSQLRSGSFEFITSIQQLPSLDSPLLQFTAYESLEFEHAIGHPRSSLVSAYVIRKALIRKHYLSNSVATWLVKHPHSVLRRHFKASVNFELDYAEFLDEALVDAWDLNESMARNEARKDDIEKKEWWILKPGMSDGGNGIRMFSSMQQLQEIFKEWEEDEKYSGDEEEKEEEEKEEEKEEKEEKEEEKEEKEEKVQSSDKGREQVPAPSNGTMTSQLRHFIAQPYIDPPLLLPTRDDRKFHVRVYVLAVGALTVYVHKEMLALFASDAYQSPSELDDGKEIDLLSHLTNTCFQDDSSGQEPVARFWDLEDATLTTGWKEEVCQQICEVTGEVFEAAAREQMVHFQTLPNAFEIFGVDFLVDAGLDVWLLELNAYPDFKQTGQELQDSVVGGLFRDVVKLAVRPFFDNTPAESVDSGEMIPVLDIDLGRG